MLPLNRIIINENKTLPLTQTTQKIVDLSHLFRFFQIGSTCYCRYEYIINSTNLSTSFSNIDYFIIIMTCDTTLASGSHFLTIHKDLTEKLTKLNYN